MLNTPLKQKVLTKYSAVVVSVVDVVPRPRRRKELRRSLGMGMVQNRGCVSRRKGLLQRFHAQGNLEVMALHGELGG